MISIGEWNIIFKLLKNLSFFATGAGVAVDLAATKVYPFAATAGSLTAVIGGSAYSVFKNFETASNVNKQGQYCSEILKDMHKWAGVDSMEELLCKLEMTQEEIKSLLANISVVSGNARQGYKYAVINAAVQVTLSIISIWINATASRRGNDDVWDSVNVTNMFVVPALIFSQYIIHSAFIASPLRKMDNRSMELSSKLEKLKGSVPVQIWKLNKLTSEVNNYRLQLKELNENIGHDEASLAATEQEAERIGKEKEVEAQLADLSKQQDELEQMITSKNEAKQRVSEQLQVLVNDINRLMAGLKTSFDQYQQFDNIYRHLQTIKPQLNQEISDSSFSTLEML